MADKILVIDDDLDSLKLIGLLLQRHGYEVAAAPGGAQGLAQAEEDPPDLVLLDLMMPDMDGYEVCRRLRSDPHLAHIPVIMFTAKTRVDDKVAGFEAGADDYLTKPTHPAELAARVKAMLERNMAEPGEQDAEPRAPLVAVLGVKGGSGVTTLAINLSAALQEREKRVVLADLQHGSGAVGMALGIPEGDGYTRLLRTALAELTAERLEENLSEYGPDFRLLLSAYDPTEAGMPLSANHFERILGLLAKTADVAILDYGSRVTGVMLSSLRLVDRVLLCLPPQPSSIRIAQTLVTHLERLGLTREQIGVVGISTVPAMQPPTSAQVTEGLDLVMMGRISAAPEMGQEAALAEKPLLELYPGSTEADEYRILAEQLLSKLTQAESG
jgi:pilus assembly protein CpaE